MGIFRLLGTRIGGLTRPEAEGGPFRDFTNAVASPLNTFIIIMFALFGVGAIIFAIWVGFRLARAEDEGKRKEAKQQLLWSLIAIIAAAGFAILFGTLFAHNGFFGTKPNVTINEAGELNAIGTSILTLVNETVGIVLRLFAIAAMFFAVYLGFRLAMAQDEGKRKEAKQQLLWTLVAIVGAMALTMLIQSTLSSLAGQVPYFEPV